MNPYEKTAAEMKRQGEGPKRLAKTAAHLGAAAGVATGAASFAPILARAAPFLSQYIPEDLAIKGLSKINPRFGAFIKSAIDGGYDFSQVKDFIGKQIMESQAPTQPKDNRNIIEQHSPELNTFLSERIKGGEDPIRAAALALFEKGNPFEPIIRKIEKEHKTNWSQLVQSIYGGGQGQPPAQSPQQGQPNALGQEAMNPPGSQPTSPPSAEAQAAQTQQRDLLAEARNLVQQTGNASVTFIQRKLGIPYAQAAQVVEALKAESQQQQQPQGQGQGAQALQAILQKINQRLGG